jgi:zinc protease
LADLHWTEVDGVTTVWTESEGPLFAELVFRTAVIDESLVTAGRTHLLEHIVLAAVGEKARNQNGYVASAHTGFRGAGSPEEVASFLSGVCVALADVPGDRLQAEKQVLEAERASRSPDLVADMLTWRYGATGYGLLGVPQLGFRAATLEQLRGLATERFTRGNAVLCLSGPPPLGLQLRLAPGAKQPIPRLEPIQTGFPRWVIDEEQGGVAVAATVPRTSAAIVLTVLARRMLYDRLRTQRALSYAPQVMYEPLNADTAHIVLGADSDKDHRLEMTGEFASVLQMLGRPTEADIEAARRECLDDLAGSLMAPEQRAFAEVWRAVMGWVLGGEFQPRDTLEAGVAAVTKLEVEALARSLRQAAIFALPSGARPRPMMGNPVRLLDRRPVEGRQVVHVDAPINRERLVHGEEGVSWRYPQGSCDTVRYSDLAAAFAYEDGSIGLVADTGGYLMVEPTMWRHGLRVAQEIRGRVPTSLLIDMQRPPEAVPGPSTTKRRRLLARLLLPVVPRQTYLPVQADLDDDEIRDDWELGDENKDSYWGEELDWDPPRPVPNRRQRYGFGDWERK